MSSSKKTTDVGDEGVNSTKVIKKSLARRLRLYKSKVIKISAVFLMVLAVGSAGYFYKQYSDVKSNPGQVVSKKNAAESEKVITAVKRSILIDEQETPSVARVEAPETLQKNNQTFYKNIKKGDYVVIFPERAIIYRLQDSLIVNIAPIVKNSDAKSSSSTSNPAGTQPAQTTPAKKQ